MHNTYTCYITPTFAILVFVGILVLAFFVANLCNPQRFKGTRVNIFISCLAGLSIIVTFLFYYAVVTLQQAQQRYAIIELTSNVNKFLLEGIVNEINHYSLKIPHFISTLFPLLQHTACSQSDVDCEEHGLLIFKISYKIFSIWQEVMLATPLVDINIISLLSNFLQRANSSMLYDQWLKCKLDFNPDTQQFGELLFRYASKIKKQTVDAYVAAATKMSKDKEFLKLMVD